MIQDRISEILSWGAVQLLGTHPCYFMDPSTYAEYCRGQTEQEIPSAGHRSIHVLIGVPLCRQHFLIHHYVSSPESLYMMMSTPTVLKVWPCTLWTVMAKHGLQGNCRRLSENGTSFLKALMVFLVVGFARCPYWTCNTAWLGPIDWRDSTQVYDWTMAPKRVLVEGSVLEENSL